MASIRTLVVPAGATVEPGEVTGPEWTDMLTDTAPLRTGHSDNTFLARIASQWHWIKLPSVDPTSPAYGLSTAGTEADNRTALMQAATDAAALAIPVKPPPGEYPLAANTALPTNAILEGVGSDQVIFTRGSGGNTPTITVSGSVGTSTALSVDAVAGNTSVTTATDPGLAAGDLAFLTSTRTVGTSAGPVGYELAWVASVSGAGPYTIELASPLLHAFATADASAVAKVTPARPHLAGFGIRVTGAAQARGVQLLYTDGAVVEDYAINDYYTSGLDIRASIAFRASGYRADDPSATTSGLGYGINVREGSRDGLIESLVGHRNRHLVVVTQASSYITVRDGYGYSGAFGDFDAHGHECRFLLWDNCHAHSTVGGYNAGNASYAWDADITYRNCTGRGNITSPSQGHFRFVGGATRIDLDNPQTNIGNAAIYLNGASNVRARGGMLRDHIRAIDATDTIGVLVDGTTIRGSTSNAIRSQGTSNYWRLLGPEYVSCAAGESLVGANNIVANAMTR